MLNDEEILLKTTNLLENFDIATKKPDKLLRELDDTELGILDDILDDMKGEDLAFNALFDGEMRKVIDFPTLDTSSELGKFGEFFKKQDFTMDWEKGMLSAERDIRNSDDLLGDLIRIDRGGQEEKKTKKIQMKIGKYFAKVADLSSKRDVFYQKIFDYKGKFSKKALDKYGEDPRNLKWWKERNERYLTGYMKREALDEKEFEDYNRISTQLDLYIPNPGVAGPAGYNLTDLATKMAKYWQTNAGYIKKEINKLDNDKYSIIITRHPIDVMRMSDFDNISSCHSPPSRTGGSQEYYKCAVAEARGHGALAYVVETEDLLHLTNTSNIESAEQEIQEGEIFADEERGSGIGLDGDLKPISRTRLRQVRYYDTDAPKRWDDGTEVAMPEQRVYGAGIPGLVDRVTGWARANQEEVIKGMPADTVGDGIDLDKFMIFGGSYEDTANESGRRQLMAALLDRPIGDFEGGMKQNTETENALDANALSGMVGMWRIAVEHIVEEWNNRYANTHIEAEVEDDHDGGFYISATATMKFEWDLDEFTKLPNSYPTAEHAFNSINDIWGDIFDLDSSFLNKWSPTQVRMGAHINFEHPDLTGDSYLVDPDALNEMCAVIDTKMDDRRDAFKATLEEFLKREGYMQGGEYMNLAIGIEDGDVTSYEWDLDSDGEYYESYESYASYSFEYNPEAAGISYEVLVKLLGSREYKLLLRTNLLAAPRAEVGTEYQLDIAHYAVAPSGQEAVVQIQFKITADDPDERVELFKELFGGEMDDEDNLTVVFNKTLAQIKEQSNSGQWAGNVNEGLVKRWKSFLG